MSDPIPPALRRYATVVTWLFVLGMLVLIAVILIGIFG
jgi:hypothetical protein